MPLDIFNIWIDKIGKGSALYYKAQIPIFLTKKIWFEHKAEWNFIIGSYINSLHDGFVISMLLIVHN